MAFFEVDEENFDEVLEEEFAKKQKIILKFGSEFCEPCFALETKLEEVDDKHKNVSVLMIDCEESPELASKYDIYQLPTMIIYKDKEKTLYSDSGVILASDIEKILGL